MARRAAALIPAAACGAGAATAPPAPPMVVVPPVATEVQYVGRFDHTKRGARFDMPGCEIRVRVQGARRVMVQLAQVSPFRVWPPGAAPDDDDVPQRNEFIVYVDGVPQPPPHGHVCPGGCTFDTHTARDDVAETYVAAGNLTPGTAHEVRVVKVTEALWSDEAARPNWVTFLGFGLDAGSALPPTRPPPRRRVEFIGDSAAAGYCNTCAGAMTPEGIQLHNLYADWTADQYWQTQLRTGVSGQSFASAWPALACGALGAECHTAAWSGAGLLRGCCGGDAAMSSVWRRTVATDRRSAWDFARWAPDALVVNVGMNDGAAVNTPEWADAYVRLVSNASAAYGPALHVFLACGPITGRYCAAVQGVVERARELGVRAHFLDQRPFLNGTYGGACCGHLGRRAAQAMADFTAAAIASQVGWRRAGFHDDYSVDELDMFNRFQCNVDEAPTCAHGLLEILSPEHSLLMNDMNELNSWRS